MRTLLVLVLLVIVAVGGFLSRPDIEAHRKHTGEVLAKEQGGGDAIGGLIGSLLGDRTDSFEDFMVATRLITMGNDKKPVLECWGAFTAFLCSKPATQAETKPE
jgi:hypothetical protein